MGGKGVPASQTAAFAAVDQSILARKVAQPLPKNEIAPIPFPSLKDESGDGSEESSVSETDENTPTEEEHKVEGEEDLKMVSVNHVLTNVIILQEFLLELAALVQVRAGLFGEVRYV